MYRVLRPGGEVLIIDMRNDATDAEIDTAVDDMRLDRVNAFLVRITFKHMLRKRAYSIPKRTCAFGGKADMPPASLRKMTVCPHAWLHPH